MSTTPEQLLQLIAGTRFADRAHALLPRSGGVAVAFQIDPPEAREAWEEARALLDASGRWPVAITTWPQQAPAVWEVEMETLLDPQGFAGADRPPVEAILTDAAAVDLDATLARLEDDEWREWLGDEVEGTVEWAASEMAYWFEPAADQPTALVFLPSPDPWATVAYESWYAEDGGDVSAAELTALLKRWNERHGAEPIAHWGTMLQLRVERPPADIEQARALAREQLLVAPCTALLPGTHPELHAQGLMQATSWFLHERP